MDGDNSPIGSPGSNQDPPSPTGSLPDSGDDVAGPQSPTGSLPDSNADPQSPPNDHDAPPYSPVGSADGPASPDATNNPQSPTNDDYNPLSPGEINSPDQARSIGSPASPGEERSPQTPTEDEPKSPGAGSPQSRTSSRRSRSRSQSPSNNRDQSPSNDRDQSPPASPDQQTVSRSDRSPPGSPSVSQYVPETQTSPTGAGPMSPDDNSMYTNHYGQGDVLYNDARSPSPSSAMLGRSRSPSPQPHTQTSPTGAGPQSPPGSPYGSEPRSPIPVTQTSPTGAGPHDPDYGPQSPGDDGPVRETQTSPTGAGPTSPQSPADYPGSPDGPQSPAPYPQSPLSPTQPQSPDPEKSGGESPDPRDGPDSPRGPQSPDPQGDKSPGRDSPTQDGRDSPVQDGGDSPVDYGGDSPERPPMSPTSPPVTHSRLDDDDDDLDLTVSPKKKNAAKIVDDDDSDKESAVGELIADIFGSSDDEEEFEGFGEADVETTAAVDNKKGGRSSEGAPDDLYDDEKEDEEPAQDNDIVPDISDDEFDIINEPKPDFVSDFDVMMDKRKAENAKRRRRKRDEENITANDDLIDEMVKSMKEAAAKDRQLNESKKAATSKLVYLPHVSIQLKKADLHGNFIDGGILNAMTFPSISSDTLKTSGIGKAVMYLYKHPKETRSNREIAGKLINEWSRPIFNLTSNFKLLSKEEREQRDYDQLPKKRRISAEGGETPRPDIDNALAGEERALRPGDPGWVIRARVPIPSTKDYVVRPKWNIEEVNSRPPTKKKISRYEKHKRAFADKKKKAKNILTMSIEGRNMGM